MAQEDVEEVLDLRGLKCPLPALFAKKALAARAPGAPLTVLTDDPLAPIDVPHMCAQEGYAVVSVTREGGRARMILCRPVGPPA